MLTVSAANGRSHLAKQRCRLAAKGPDGSGKPAAAISRATSVALFRGRRQAREIGIKFMPALSTGASALPFAMQRPFDAILPAPFGKVGIRVDDELDRIALLGVVF